MASICNKRIKRGEKNIGRDGLNARTTRFVYINGGRENLGKDFGEDPCTVDVDDAWEVGTEW